MHVTIAKGKAWRINVDRHTQLRRMRTCVETIRSSVHAASVYEQAKWPCNFGIILDDVY